MRKPAAVIFDMDGVIVDSEPFWLIAMNTVFSSYDVHLEPEQYRKTTGLRLDQVIQYWKQYHDFNGKSTTEIADKTYREVLDLVCQKSGLMPGLIPLLKSLKAQGIPIALASSSSYFLIYGILDFFDLNGYFDVVQSAEDFRYGKPNPEVFIQTAQRLELEPSADIVVIEDSLNGLLAAKSARMTCVLMPEKHKLESMKFSIADKIILSLEELSSEWWHSIPD